MQIRALLPAFGAAALIAGLLIASAQAGPQASGARTRNDTLKAPDGLMFEPHGPAIDVLRPDRDRCGYNDLGAANPAVVRRQKGDYIEYQKGKEVSRRPGVQETFLRCWEP